MVTSAKLRTLGITPIYMGSTDRLVKALADLEDHPHIHGEHPLHRMAMMVVLGSPPYTWGALKQ